MTQRERTGTCGRSSGTYTPGIYEKISKECNIELISYIRRV
jgi:hypothetical protein